eukprot:TRINITY_DN32164_c0_g1_i1.p2 TRINITY_DN32164_c0_g1~~TRINITY_DN32164_c0_g1_i1.p2  ORF type:complete len:440 (+),score=118.44 TRINITY_DN32164_c0_g1_i1:67-1320(+)
MAGLYGIGARIAALLGVAPERDGSSDDESGGSHGAGRAHFVFPNLPHPTQALRIPGRTVPLPPYSALARPPARVVVKRPPRRRRRRASSPASPAGDARTGYPATMLPGPGGVTGWRPQNGCGCWVDPAGLIAKICREDKEPYAPRCVLSPCQMHQLIPALPWSLRWAPWWLVYSTDEHGYSQRELRNRTAGLYQLLLVVSTPEGDVFGGFLSDAPLKKTWDFGGSGDTFVWSFRRGRLAVHRWAGENEFFLRSFTDLSWGLGGGGDVGGQALFLSSDVQTGRSAPCPTFGSPALVGPPDSENGFAIASCELWAFAPPDLDVQMARPSTPTPDAEEGDDEASPAVQSPVPAMSPAPGPLQTPTAQSPVASSVGVPATASPAVSSLPPGASTRRRRRGAGPCKWHLTDPEHHLCCMRPL